MNSPEVFYLHLAGAQQGPYTIPQIDHLLNSGLIGIETLYWREGLEQWEPVTSLVPLRKKPRRWVRPALAAAALLALAVPVRLFGPVLLDGWHEANQHSFSTAAAYWRARDVVRAEVRKRGMLVEFAPLSEARVALQPPEAAQVRLRGSIVDARGKAAALAWEVAMRFDPDAAEWSGSPPAEAIAQ